MKKILFIIITFLIVLTPSVVKAENLTPSVDPSEKVYDFAGLLSEEEKQELYNLSIEYLEKYNMDMVLVTIDNNPYGNDDRDTFLYGMDFYDFNKFGVDTSRDGVLFIIDMDNRLPAMVTTGKAILVYNDIRINAILDSIYDYLVNADYYGAFKKSISVSSNYFDEGIPENNTDYYIDEEGQYHRIEVVYSPPPKKVDWIVSIGAGIVVSMLAFIIHIRKYRGIKLAVNANDYLRDSHINNTMDQFLTTFTSRVRRPTDNNSSHGGGFGGGGSSISHGSSGMSHGGGVGRHF
jgi:uncharacterized protein